MMRMVGIAAVALLILSGVSVMAHEKGKKGEMCPIIAWKPCDKMTDDEKAPVSKAAAKDSEHDQVFLKWEGEKPENPRGVGNHYLKCQPRGEHVCCYAEMTDHEWRNCPEKSWWFGTRGNKWGTKRVHERVYVVCLKKGHENVSYKTNAGRHLIAVFE